MGPKSPGATALGEGVRLRWAHPARFDREAALRLLGPAERARADATTHSGLRDRFLLGRMLLRELAAGTVGIRPEDVRIAAPCDRCGAEHGKPLIEWTGSAGPPPSASLSSCADLVVAAVAPAGTAVGVDAEPARFGRSHVGEAERRRAVAGLIGGPTRTAIRRWVRAEAVLKADGRGIRVEPGRVRFDGDSAHLDDRSTGYRLVDRRIGGCLVSVAVADPLLP